MKGTFKRIPRIRLISFSTDARRRQTIICPKNVTVLLQKLEDILAHLNKAGKYNEYPSGNRCGEIRSPDYGGIIHRYYSYT